jgi:hypothetical protein
MLHDANHHIGTHRRALAVVLELTLAGNHLGAEALLAESECLLCVTRVLVILLAAVDGDAYAVATIGAAHDNLERGLGREPPLWWGVQTPAVSSDLGLLE